MTVRALLFASSESAIQLAGQLSGWIAEDELKIEVTNRQDPVGVVADLDIILAEATCRDDVGVFTDKIRHLDTSAPIYALLADEGSRFEGYDWKECGFAGSWHSSEVTREALVRAAGKNPPTGAATHHWLPPAVKFHRTLLAYFPNGAVSLVDKNLKFLFAEGEGLPQIGLSSEMLVGKTLLEIHGDSTQYHTIKKLCLDALLGQTGRSDIDFRGRSRSLTAVPVKDSDGQIFAAMLVSQDMTEWKRAQAELNVSRNRLSGIVNSAMDAIITVDEAQRIQFFNPAAERMFGYSIGEVVDRPLDRLMPERYRASHGNHVAQFGSTGQTARRMGSLGEISGLRANGEEFPIEASISQVQLDGQKLYTVILRDISARQEAENALARSREELQAAHDSLERRVRERTEALAEANEDLRASEARLMHANQIFTELAELRATTSEEVTRALERITQEGSAIMEVQRCSVWAYNEDHTALECLSLYDQNESRHYHGAFLRPADRPEYFDEVLTGTAIFVRRQRESGTEGEVPSSALVARLTVTGRCIGILKSEHLGDQRMWKAEEETLAGTLATICSLTFESYERASAETAQRLAKEEAEKARDEAEKANAAKSEFLSRMSHELRTPLNSILGFAQILEMTAKNEKEIARVDYILRGGRHLLRLVDEVLDIARVESGNLALSPEPVNLQETVEMALDLLRPLIQENGLKVHFDIGGHGKVFVNADQQRLSQVLLNLLSNAVKYNRPKGSITISTISDEEVITLEISDTGPGIPAEKIGKLFQPFERLGAEAGPVPGTGLGLALSRRLIEAMNGSMGVRSTPGEGSCFWFKLPRVEPLSASRGANRAPAFPPAIGGSHTLLYIEDNLTNFQVIQEVLEDQPEIQIISAMQGQLGLDLARQHRPSLIMLDLHLPDIRGEDVLRALKSDETTRAIPVLIVTADATPKLGSRLKEAGATEYLSKPLDVRQFLEIVRSILTTEAHS